MFERQQITINKDVFSEYQRELNYLQAEQLLVLENNEISFFHQSFYDYVYAKDFVESKRSLEKYIENSGQSLLIRSAVKMILNYQREFDHDLYIRQLKLSLRKRNVAFHIKHLIVSGLSVEAKPSIKEKHLFSKVISKNRELLNVFYEHTRSTLWLEYLEAKGYLQALVKTNKDAEERILIRGLKKFQNLFKKNKRADVTTSTELNTCFHLMVRNLPDARNVAVRFFSGIDNENLISRILYNLKIWDSQESFVLLEKYPGIMKISNWVYYPILEDILYYNADYVLEKIKPTLLLQKEEHQHGYSEHGRKELLQKLLKKKPCELMDYLFGIIESELKEKSYKYDENIFLSDWIFNDVQIYAQDDNYLDGLKYFYYLLADGLRQQAAEESNWFRAFLTTNIQSRYKAVLRLLIYAIVTNEKIYTTETIELLSYLHINSFLDSTGKLNFELRNLIRGSYSHFNNNQSRVILDIMRKINGKREIGVWKDSEGRKHIHRWWGITQFHFLNIVPENILKQDLKLFRRWQELHRKFKGQKDNNGSSARGGVVGPPLKAGAYKHMDDKSWINSFRKYYSDSSGRSSSMDDDFLKGGITEHSRAFCEAVKNNPSRFMQLIDTIIDDQSIPVDYAIKGIEGIQASEILLDSISPFLVRVIQRGVSNFNIHACIWIIKRLDDGKVLNNVLLDFLIHESLHNPDPTPERITQIEQHNQTIDSMLQAGINTARGAAANALVTLNEKIYEEEIFQTLEIIFEKDIAIVKVPPLNYFAYLMNINQDRAFDFFTKIITSEKNSDILTAGIWSMQYLIHYDFSRLVGYFRKLISKDDLTENEVRNLTTILFASWLNDYPGAEDLFKTFLKRHEGSHSAALHNCFDFFYFKSEVSQKTIKILEYLLNEAEKKVIKRFEAEFRSMDKIAFLDVYPFLLKYVVSSVFNISDYFLEYLIRHCYNYPVECIGLFEMAIDNDHLESEDGENYFRENDSITKFIIGAYTVLRPSHIDSHRMYQKKLLNAFDKILKNPRFRTNTEKVLERIIG